MRSDVYLLLTCKHTPNKRIEIGTGKHKITQWRCACGKIVPPPKDVDLPPQGKVS